MRYQNWCLSLPSLFLLGLGLFRIVNAGHVFSGLTESDLREYALHVGVGFFFGWALWQGFLSLGERSGNRALTAFALVGPLLVLIMAHQTRGLINDGPITLAMGVAYTIAWLIGLRRREE